MERKKIIRNILQAEDDQEFRYFVRMDEVWIFGGKKFTDDEVKNYKNGIAMDFVDDPSPEEEKNKCFKIISFKE